MVFVIPRHRGGPAKRRRPLRAIAAPDYSGNRRDRLFRVGGAVALADRIVVMFEGRLVGELAAADATPEALGLLMAGQAA